MYYRKKRIKCYLSTAGVNFKFWQNEGEDILGKLEQILNSGGHLNRYFWYVLVYEHNPPMSKYIQVPRHLIASKFHDATG